MQNTLKRIRKKMYLIKTTLLFDELFLFKLELLTLSLEFLRSIKNEKLTLLLKAWKVTTKLPHWQWKYLLPETNGSGMSILGTTSRTQFIPFYQQLAFHFLIWLHLLPVHCVHWGLNYQTDWGVRDHCLSSHHCFAKKLPFKPWDISKCRTCTWFIRSGLGWMFRYVTCPEHVCSMTFLSLLFILCTLTLHLCNSHPSNVLQVKLPVLRC